MNRKLYNDNTNLVKSLEKKEAEITDLNHRYSELLSDCDKLSEDKLILERNVSKLHETTKFQKDEISKLIEDNKKLVRLVNDNDKTIKSIENERIKQMSRIEELSFDLKNANGKLNSAEDSLNYTQKQLEDTKNSKIKFQMNLKDMEKQNEMLRSENNHINLNLQREKSAKYDGEKTIEKLQILLSERDQEVNNYVADLDDVRQNNNRILDEKHLLDSENDRLKSHIMTLTEQNQKVNKINKEIIFGIFKRY